MALVTIVAWPVRDVTWTVQTSDSLFDDRPPPSTAHLVAEFGTEVETIRLIEFEFGVGGGGRTQST